MSGTSTGDTALDIPQYSTVGPHANVPLASMQLPNGLKSYPIYRICPRWEWKACFCTFSGNGVWQEFYNHQHTCYCTTCFVLGLQVQCININLHSVVPNQPLHATVLQLGEYIFQRILLGQLQAATTGFLHIHPTTQNTMATMTAGTGFMSWLFRPIDVTPAIRNNEQKFLMISTEHDDPPTVVNLQQMYQWLNVQVNGNNQNPLRDAMILQISKHLEDLWSVQVRWRHLIVNAIVDPGFLPHV